VPSPSRIPPTSLGTLAVGVVVVAALYFGREVFVPTALAILLGFALAPPVLVLRRWHFGRVPSVIVVVALAFVMIADIGFFVGNQLAHLAGNCPDIKPTSPTRSIPFKTRELMAVLSTVPLRC
jgi:predicted PurR-regulated permease PerM